MTTSAAGGYGIECRERNQTLSFSQHGREEAVIAAMAGLTLHTQRKRESGFLGDSTLPEICTDYTVPISYIADVLCLWWGVSSPIHVEERLGDLVTGEQAFALLEADASALHDRYSNQSLLQVCAEWDTDLQQGFIIAMREGWSLPFGVQTCLRVEQYDPRTICAGYAETP